MKLTWSRLAVSDRESIFDYIAADNVIAAIKLDELFQAKASLLLADYPHIGRPGRVPGTREFLVHRHYVFVYDIQQSQGRIRILRVLHTALQYPPAKQRRSARKSK